MNLNLALQVNLALESGASTKGYAPTGKIKRESVRCSAGTSNDTELEKLKKRLQFVSTKGQYAPKIKRESVRCSAWRQASDKFSAGLICHAPGRTGGSASNRLDAALFTSCHGLHPSLRLELECHEHDWHKYRDRRGKHPSHASDSDSDDARLVSMGRDGGRGIHWHGGAASESVTGSD
jgi:hypothetical protein